MIVKPLAKLLVKRPKMVFLLFTVITALIGINATNIYIQSDMSAYLPSDAPTMQLLDEILEEFQMGATIIIYINQVDKVYDIRDPKVLSEMDEVIQMIDLNPLDDGEDGVLLTRSISNYIKEENAKPK
jgi:predicted RND superfamily exporter protein